MLRPAMRDVKDANLDNQSFALSTLIPEDDELEYSDEETDEFEQFDDEEGFFDSEKEQNNKT